MELSAAKFAHTLAQRKKTTHTEAHKCSPTGQPLKQSKLDVTTPHKPMRRVPYAMVPAAEVDQRPNLDDICPPEATLNLPSMHGVTQSFSNSIDRPSSHAPMFSITPA